MPQILRDPPMGREMLLARADRAFAGRPVQEAVAKVRAIIGVPEVPDSEKAAQAALEKLKRGERPEATELAALELVIRMMRPAPLSSGGHLQPLPAGPGTNLYDPDLTEEWERFRGASAPLMYSIGRIDRAQGPDPAMGTGFLVADGVLVTNRHVVDALSFGAGVLEQGQAVVRFQQERGAPDTLAPAPIVGVVAIHDSLDMALLAVQPPDATPALPLSAQPARNADMVVAVGYPMADPSSPLFADAIYEGAYGVKRGALGQVVGTGPERLLHDCSTLGGSSGSPMLSLLSAEVVGLHCSGLFMYRNEAVPAGDLAAFVAASV